MSLRFVSLGLAMAAVLNLSQSVQAQDADAPESMSGQIGYFLGISMGQQMRGNLFQSEDIDLEALKAGFADGLAGKDPELSDEQLQATQTKIQAILQERRKTQMAVEKAAGQKWLAANAEKEGVKALEGGLQYKVLKSGSGESPEASDTVRVHYTGKLINGEVFDSSVERGQPAEFPVGRVIRGWTMALQKMKVGDKWMLYIPPELAYGAQGSPPAIGPNEVLIFEVELLDIL